MNNDGESRREHRERVDEWVRYRIRGFNGAGSYEICVPKFDVKYTLGEFRARGFYARRVPSQSNNQTFIEVWEKRK